MNYDEIDKLVEDYLIFRNYSESAKKLQSERDAKAAFGPDENNPDENDSGCDLRESIIKALETSESLRLLTMWDNYVIKGLSNLPSEMIAEARIAEFYLHLFCATYPFRDDILQSLNSPAEAAKYAARAMTVFKHFTETRGRRLTKTPEFQGFKTLHKIAFPPTHPTYSYMFRKEWQTMAKGRVADFLEKFFKAKQAPQLFILLQEASEAQYKVAIMNDRENDIRSAFKIREQKLMDFSRSIYSISNDLLNAIDEGGDLNQEFIYKFRLKFDEFHEVLGSDVPPPTRLHPAAKRKKKKLKVRKEPHFTELDYNVVSKDVSSMVTEVGSELSSLGGPGKVLSVIDVEMAMGSAMQGGAIFDALREYVTRDKDDSVAVAHSGGAGTAGDGNPAPVGTVEGILQTRVNAAKLLMEEDIFQIRGSALAGAAPSKDNDLNYMDSSGYVISFLRVYGLTSKQLCDHPYNRDLTKRAKHKSITDNMENHYGELFEAASVLVYSICRLLGSIAVTLPMQDLLTSKHPEETSAGLHALYDVVIDVLMALPDNLQSETEHPIIKNIRILLLLVIVTLSNDRKHKLTIVKKGLMEWLANMIGTIVDRADNATSDGTTKYDKDLFFLCAGLISSVVESSEAFRAVVASVRAMTSCQKIFQVMTNILLGNSKVNLQEQQTVVDRVCLRSVNAIVSEKVVLEYFKQEHQDLLDLLQNKVKTFTEAEDLLISSGVDAANEMSLISKHFIRVTGGTLGSGDDVVNLYTDVHKMKSVAECLSFMSPLFKSILLQLPQNEFASEYITEHPKGTGMLLLVNYSKAYLEEHGSYETSEHIEQEDDEEEAGMDDDVLIDELIKNKQ